jgi:hypothetical protein
VTLTEELHNRRLAALIEYLYSALERARSELHRTEACAARYIRDWREEHQARVVLEEEVARLRSEVEAQRARAA